MSSQPPPVKPHGGDWRVLCLGARTFGVGVVVGVGLCVPGWGDDVDRGVGGLGCPPPWSVITSAMPPPTARMVATAIKARSVCRDRRTGFGPWGGPLLGGEFIRSPGSSCNVCAA